MTNFDIFWSRYPRKVARAVAMKAYAKAVQKVDPQVILDGLENYCQHLPSENQYILHASTFLNQERWTDEYEQEPQLSKSTAKVIQGAREFLRVANE